MELVITSLEYIETNKGCTCWPLFPYQNFPHDNMHNQDKNESFSSYSAICKSQHEVLKMT